MDVEGCHRIGLLFCVLLLPTLTVTKKPKDIVPTFDRYEIPSYHGARDRNVKSRCEDITIPMCKDMLYNMTILPNLMNHQNQADAGMEANQFYPLVKVGCSPGFIDFLCSMYAPPCTVLEYPIPPCKSLCQSAKDGCEPIMNHYGYVWPDKLACDLFPEQGADTLCIESLRLKSATTESSPQDRPNGTFCYESLDGRMDDILIEFCKADFVMKVRLEEITSTVQGTTYLISERRRTLYKTENLKKRDLKTFRMNAQDVIDGECCDIMKPGEDYLIMGYKNQKKLIINTVHAWSKEIRNVANRFENVQCF